MQIVRTSHYGDGLHSCKFTLYLNSTELSDIRKLLIMSLVPFEDSSDEDIRQNFLRYFSPSDIRRMQSILNQLSLSL